MTDLALLSASKRLTIVSSLGSESDGDSLAGQNVQSFPAGALFYVKAAHRFYELRKNLDPLVVPATRLNVIDGVGSSAVNGRFVAVQQFGFGALVAGVLTLDGFDLTNFGLFLVTYAVPTGTQGFLHGTRLSVNSVAINSSSSSDTSSVNVVFVENSG